MAFRQPTHHTPQRIYTAPSPSQPEPQTQPHPSQQPADEQEWILFSPVADSATNRTYTATTATCTDGHSRISDFGSFNTAARSYDIDGQSEDEGAVEDDEAEEDGELDSLDSHLHEFRSEPSVYRRSGEASGTVLPTHDGLGSFRVDRSGEEVQEHLYAFERFNPRRIKRRRESLEFGQLELGDERVADSERVRRIEQWRMEQSRVLVDEIQKETRRRRLSMSTDKRSLVQDREQEDLATLSTIEQDESVVDPESETFWNRITRRVIRDLMGIDDDLLSILFGETLPEDDDLSTTPPATRTLNLPNGLIPASHYDASSWEHKLLERISRELGMLVNQISDHPGAFNTYIHTQQLSLPYAGLPVIPETSNKEIPSNPATQPLTTNSLNPLNPTFQPTIQTQPLPIPSLKSTISLAQPDDLATPRQSTILTREEWEADLDIKMVFHYLRNRFTSKFGTSSQVQSTTTTLRTPSNLATASTADTAARAARVRQHHPLINNRRRSIDRSIDRGIERRTWRVSVPAETQTGLVKERSAGRRGSSCASERLERGVGVSGVGVRSGSSRHYWDFGPGSVGSGSLITSAGGGGGGGMMGSWGEV